MQQNHSWQLTPLVEEEGEGKEPDGEDDADDKDLLGSDPTLPALAMLLVNQQIVRVTAHH